MGRTRHRLIIFDIDGTLLLSGPLVRRLFAQAFEESFATEAPHESLAFAGRTDRGIVRELCRLSGTSDRFDRGFPPFVTRYTALMQRHYPGDRGPYLLPGVRPLLEALAAEDTAALMIGSGNLEGTAHIKLARFGLDGFFPTGVYGDHHEERDSLFAGCLELARERLAYEGNGEEVWFVGDTVADVRAAKALGARCLAVGTGPPGCGELDAAGADFFLPDLSATPRALEILLA